MLNAEMTEDKWNVWPGGKHSHQSLLFRHFLENICWHSMFQKRNWKEWVSRKLLLSNQESLWVSSFETLREWRRSLVPSSYATAYRCTDSDMWETYNAIYIWTNSLVRQYFDQLYAWNACDLNSIRCLQFIHQMFWVNDFEQNLFFHASGFSCYFNMSPLRTIRDSKRNLFQIDFFGLLNSSQKFKRVIVVKAIFKELSISDA